MRKLRMMNAIACCLLLSSVFVVSGFAEQGDPIAGKAVYDKLCATCHGTTGKGDGPAAAVLPTKPRNHTDGQYMNALTDDYIFQIIRDGGVAVGKAQFMPAWGDQVADPEIWNIIAYIRTLAAPPYQPAGTANSSAPQPAAPGSEPQAQKK